ncbi:MAG: MarR family EPS-associated transcriptional regulator [Chromatiaceae bacterium]|nr:MarR family EPS-associated transcriptional regulator [Chromatiaceae bacterium]
MPSPVRPQQAEDNHYRFLRQLEQNPHRTQREFAAALGVSVGTVNNLLKAFVANDWVSCGIFQRGKLKLDKIAYLPTPAGIKRRRALTPAYLARKTQEYEALQAEIAELRAELAAAAKAASRPKHQR